VTKGTCISTAAVPSLAFNHGAEKFIVGLLARRFA
jgi:hypothetical protein